MSLLRNWLRNETGISSLEFAMLAPFAVTILLGTADIGYALWLQRKLLSATQSVGDLLAREDALNPTKVTDTIRAAELILHPYAVSNLGYDVIGVEFLAANGQPTVRWRRTVNMTPDPRFPLAASGLGANGEGVIGVVMTYTYRPVFSGHFLGDVPMTETAFLRGRRVSLIPYTS